MAIEKGDNVTITELALTPDLRGLTGTVMSKTRNGHYIVKFAGDGNLYIFGEEEVKSWSHIKHDGGDWQNEETETAEWLCQVQIHCQCF